MRIDLLQVNRMSFLAKGQGELKLRRLKFRNFASVYFTYQSSQSDYESMTEPDNMQTAFFFR